MKFSLYVETVSDQTGITEQYGIEFEGCAVPNISARRDRVEWLIEELNRSDVSMVHAEEIIEDFESGWILQDLCD